MESAENKLSFPENLFRSATGFGKLPAIESPEGIFSYKQLLDEAERIRDLIIRARSTSPFVAVIADKSLQCYASILGILMADKAYLPLNPRFPESRNRFMIRKSGAGLLLHDGLPERLDAEHTQLAEVADGAGLPAYLLFTSGTTGEPKGVVIRRKQVEAYLRNITGMFPFYPSDRFTQNFDLTFDLSVHDLFLCWTSGACLCVPADSSAFGMSKFLRAAKPTVWFSVPTTALLLHRMRLLQPNTFPWIRLSFFCGEPLLESTAVAWKSAVSGAPVVNLYGPTEATIAISAYRLPNDENSIGKKNGIVSIGRIFNGNQYLLRDFSGQQSSELCLAGSQVIPNYFHNAEADRQAFFTDPVTGMVFYRTGDLAESDSEGNLYYLGRIDSEVKIAGYRVNLKEVEHALSAIPGVAQPVAAYHAPGGVLFAFILAEGQRRPDEVQVRDHCLATLPWYMVPGKIIFVDEIPLNENGKTDRKKLLEIYDG